MTSAKPIKAPVEPPVVEPVDETEPEGEYIEYREQFLETVDLPGQGQTQVQNFRTHRVLLRDWAAYEKAHGWA